MRIYFAKGKGSYGFLPLLLGKYRIGGMYILNRKNAKNSIENNR